jgi:hypothetical chaperone protein
MWYAIDFGTSNSLLSFVDNKGAPKLLNLEKGGPVLRSLIFTPEKDSYFFGAEAIDHYQDAGGEGRFFRSLKKFLPEPGFKGTEVFGRRMKIEELIATFLREMKRRADIECGADVVNVVMGRPALYSLDPKKDELAQERMHKACLIAGFKRVEFCAEPIAAGLNTEPGHKEEIVLICDFGGGTSDFTLLKTGAGDFKKEHVLGLSGVFVAGDAVDGRIMRNFVSSHFGKDVKYKTPVGDQLLSFPRKFLTKLCNPAHIVFLKERETWEFLKELENWVVEGKDQRYFEQLFCLVEEDLGYPVYASIEKTKIQLGLEDKAAFSFHHPGIGIDMEIEREQFNSSVEGELEEIFNALQRVFDQSGLRPEEVHKVSITGGTGQMPLIRERLESLFGKEKIQMGEVFQSVVQGLGRYAAELK